MAFSSITQTNIAFKRLSGLANTLNSKAVNEEAISSNISLSTQTVFGNRVDAPSHPYKLDGSNRGVGLYWTNSIVEKVRLPLSIMAGTNLGNNNSQGYYATLPAVYTGTSLFSSSTILYNTFGRLQVVPPSFNYGYTVDLLKSDGTPIDALSPINWIFDYYNGVLFVQDPPLNFDSSLNRPAFAECFIYTGLFSSDIAEGNFIAEINNQTGRTQTLITGNTGLDFNIFSNNNVHQINIPTASSSTTRGLVSNTDYIKFESRLSNISGITAGGDLTGLYPNPTLQVITTGSTVGSSTQIPVITYDSKGRVISASTAPIGVLNAIASINFLTGSTQYIVTANTSTDFRIISSGNTHAISIPTAASGITRGLLHGNDFITFSNKLSQNQLNVFSGDVYGSGTTSTTLTLKTIISGKTVGSQIGIPIITYDDKGRITSAYTINLSSSTSGHIIQYSGISLPTRTNLNFIGNNIFIYDDLANNATVISSSTLPLTSGTIITSLGYVPYNPNTNIYQYVTGSTLIGDVYGSGTTIITTVLKTITSGKTVGQNNLFPIITYDDKGRIISSTTEILTSGTVITSLGYEPYNTSNPQQFITFVSADTRYYPLNNPNGYITGITLSSAITSINNQLNSFQTLVTGDTGLDFNINSLNGIHQFNIPTASSSTTRGLLRGDDYIIFSTKQNALGYVPLSGNSVQAGTYNTLLVDSKGLVVSGSNIQYLTQAITSLTFSLVTNALGYTPLSGLTVTGDVTGFTTNNSILLNLQNITSGRTVGSSTQIPVITYDNTGRIISSSTVSLNNFTNCLQLTDYIYPALPLSILDYANCVLNDQTYTYIWGDVYGSGSTTIFLYLQEITNGQTVGSSTQIPVITYDNKGRIVSATTVSFPSGGITSITSSLVTNALGYVPLSGNSVQAGTYNTLLVDSKGLIVSGTNIQYLTQAITSLTFSLVTNALGYVPLSGLTVTGDVTGFTTNNSILLNLQNITTGRTVGSSTQIPVITYDSKGRIISSSSVSFTSGGITSLTFSLITNALGYTPLSGNSVQGGTYNTLLVDSKGLVVSGTNISYSTLTGLTSINNITLSNQFLTTGNTGSDFNILSSGNTHVFNIPTASSSTTRGLVSNVDWTRFNNKLSSTILGSGNQVGSSMVFGSDNYFGVKRITNIATNLNINVTGGTLGSSFDLFLLPISSSTITWGSNILGQTSSFTIMPNNEYVINLKHNGINYLFNTSNYILL